MTDLTFTLRQARKYAGLTQAEVAKRLGVDRTTYIKLERDPRRATVAQIEELSEMTQIPAGEIFGGCASKK